MRRRLFLLAVPALTACSNWADDVAGPSLKNLPPTVSAQQGLADRYIVVFRDDVQNPAALANGLSAQYGGTLHFTYAYAIKGFAATLPAAAIDGLSRNPNVSYIEPDAAVTVSDGATDNTVSSWGLDRIDQRDLPLSSSYTWSNDASNVHAYIVDTGIRMTHTQFVGRVSFGYDAIGDGQNGNDCHGHGTHVSGTVGGSEYGVARGVQLVAVRVLNCAGSGSTSGVIAGIDWVRQNAVTPAVANMSLGGGFSSSLNLAVTNAVNAGITFVVAAGNSNTDACTQSPAAAPAALTIGATTITDARASYSNFGTCVDLFAPGSSITSAWNNTDTGTNTISGTSMASPHVAGVAALYLSVNTNASPSAVESAIEGAATVGKVTNPGSGSPNLLVYTVFGGSQPPPSGDFTLGGASYKVRGFNTVDLSWSGASANVDIYRDGGIVVQNSPNDGTHTDNIGTKGGGTSYTYKVCNTGTSTCSNNFTVNF